MNPTAVRRFLTVGAVAALGAVSAAGIAAPVRVAATSCGQSDLALSQTFTAGPVDTVTVRNLGRCNAPGLTITVTASSPSSIGAPVVANPSSMSCVSTATTLTCTLNTQVSAAPSAQSAAATVSFTATVGVTYDAKTALTGTQVDPVPANNETWAAAATSSGVTVGQEKNDVPPPSGQTSTLTIVPGAVSGTGTASIQFSTLTQCPPEIVNNGGCVDRPLMLRAPTPAAGKPLQFTLSYDATNLPPISQVVLFHEPDGSSTFLQLSACKGSTLPTQGCISSSSKLSDPTLITPANPKGLYYQFLVLAPSNGNWW